MNRPSLLSSTARARIVPVRDVELVVDEIHVALVRKSLLVGQARRAPDCATSRELGRSPARAICLVAQVRVLVAFEVDVDRIDRHDRREQRAAVVAAGDQIAARDFGAARRARRWARAPS